MTDPSHGDGSRNPTPSESLDPRSIRERHQQSPAVPPPPPFDVNKTIEFIHISLQLQVGTDDRSDHSQPHVQSTDCVGTEENFRTMSAEAEEVVAKVEVDPLDEIAPAIEVVEKKVRNGVTWQEKKKAAVLRVVDKIGQEAMDLIKIDWSVLDSGNGKKDQEKANEIIIALCNLKLSQIEILSILGCGSERISKMRTRISQGETFVGQGRKPPSHAFKGPTLKYLYDFMDKWETGQHYEHRYLVEEGLTWKVLHERYQETYSTLPAAAKVDIEFMKYSTFTQYVHQRNPNLRLTKPKQETCLSCDMKTDVGQAEVPVLPSSSSSSSSSLLSMKEFKLESKHASAYKPKLLKRKATELEVEPQFESTKTGNDSDSEDGEDDIDVANQYQNPEPIPLACIEIVPRATTLSVASQIRAPPASVTVTEENSSPK